MNPIQPITPDQSRKAQRIIPNQPIHPNRQISKLQTWLPQYQPFKNHPGNSSMPKQRIANQPERKKILCLKIQKSSGAPGLDLSKPRRPAVAYTNGGAPRVYGYAVFLISGGWGVNLEGTRFGDGFSGKEGRCFEKGVGSIF